VSPPQRRAQHPPHPRPTFAWAPNRPRFECRCGATPDRSCVRSSARPVCPGPSEPRPRDWRRRRGPRTVRRAWSTSAARRAAMAVAFAVAVSMAKVRPPEVTRRSPPTRYTIWWYGRDAVGRWMPIGYPATSIDWSRTSSGNATTRRNQNHRRGARTHPLPGDVARRAATAMTLGPLLHLSSDPADGRAGRWAESGAGRRRTHVRTRR
jgi:hypothetical protein